MCTEILYFVLYVELWRVTCAIVMHTSIGFHGKRIAVASSNDDFLRRWQNTFYFLVFFAFNFFVTIFVTSFVFRSWWSTYTNRQKFRSEKMTFWYRDSERKTSIRIRNEFNSSLEYAFGDLVHSLYTRGILACIRHFVWFYIHNSSDSRSECAWYEILLFLVHSCFWFFFSSPRLLKMVE